MIEILTSPGFELVIRALNVNAKMVYKFCPEEAVYWHDAFEIWQVPDSFIDFSNNMSDQEWCSMFKEQWWRSCEGTNLEDSSYPVVKFKINDKDILCWENIDKDDEYDEDDRDYVYSNVLQYCSEEWSIGQPTNICAICVGLAKLNHMSLGQLFRGYMN